MVATQWVIAHSWPMKYTMTAFPFLAPTFFFWWWFVFLNDVCVLLLLALLYVYTFINIYHWFSPIPQTVWNTSQNRFSNNFVFRKKFLVKQSGQLWFGLIALNLLLSCHSWDLFLPLFWASPLQFSWIPSLIGRIFGLPLSSFTFLFGKKVNPQKLTEIKEHQRLKKNCDLA